MDKLYGLVNQKTTAMNIIAWSRLLQRGKKKKPEKMLSLSSG